MPPAAGGTRAPIAAPSGIDARRGEAGFPERVRRRGFSRARPEAQSPKLEAQTLQPREKPWVKAPTHGLWVMAYGRPVMGGNGGHAAVGPEGVEEGSPRREPGDRPARTNIASRPVHGAPPSLGGTEAGITTEDTERTDDGAPAPWRCARPLAPRPPAKHQIRNAKHKAPATRGRGSTNAE
jgi:hypothetical protein